MLPTYRCQFKLSACTHSEHLDAETWRTASLLWWSSKGAGTVQLLACLLPHGLIGMPVLESDGQRAMSCVLTTTYTACCAPCYCLWRKLVTASSCRL